VILTPGARAVLARVGTRHARSAPSAAVGLASKNGPMATDLDLLSFKAVAAFKRLSQPRPLSGSR
jgi:hypothetical protein